MLIWQAYAKTWELCVSSLVFFAIVAALAWWVRLPRLDVDLPGRALFWILALLWLILMCICETLIDQPRFNISKEMLDWLFMFSAFLFLPMAAPLLAGAAWALAHARQEEPAKLSGLLLVMLGAFGLACAASNVHDVIWCGTITKGFTEHFKAGYDLDLFVAVAGWFGISRETSADYATLGPYAAILVAGELLVAAASFVRLSRAPVRARRS